MKPAVANSYLSAMITSLPLEFTPALREIAALGFAYIDLVGAAERPDAEREALADSGLLVSCVAIGRGLGDGHSLDARSIETRRLTVSTMKNQIADAAALGASHCYLVPGMDASIAGLARFADSCRHLADFAGQRMVRLCVEHSPGRALATIGATLDWLEQVDLPNVFALLDIGHCLLSGEDPANAVIQAGKLLGYIQLDDNDGLGDVHWPLLTGRLTEMILARMLDAFPAAAYSGPLALELNPANPEPKAALGEGKRLMERLLEAHLGREGD